MSPDNLQLPLLLQPFFLSPATLSVVQYPLPPQWPHSQRKSNSTHRFTTRLPPLRTATLKDHSLHTWTRSGRSLLYARKSSCPRTVPCGTSDVTQNVWLVRVCMPSASFAEEGEGRLLLLTSPACVTLTGGSGVPCRKPCWTTGSHQLVPCWWDCKQSCEWWQ